MNLDKIKSQFRGEFLDDKVTKILYATDASAYREIPLGVAYPSCDKDISLLISFANENKITLIPRTAGTSLAGQVVGKGLVVDVSKTYTSILEVNKAENWVRLQPGVVRDELNLHLANYGLFFGPETSTANRAMVGGMVGNNSCGTNSIIYGSTRDHLLEVRGFLSDGSFVTFSQMSEVDFLNKIEFLKTKEEHTLEEKVYLQTFEMLSSKENVLEINEQFPKRSIRRRNTGYAIDELLHTKPFTSGSSDEFNFCKLIAGSEGTLMFITELKLHVNEMPPKHKGIVAGHFKTIDNSLRANIIALKYNPSAVELIDHYILECTKANKEQMANRFFVDGDPAALLCIELFGESIEEVNQKAREMEAEMRAAGLGYHFPILYGDDIKKIWTLRKAGLGLLSNLPGDEKAVPVIEDTAVDVNDLPEFIEEFNIKMTKRGLSCVHYAHAGSGELHLRPIINLKTPEGNQQFRDVAQDISTLVKKYKGSLSGEHGDGRLRAEFIPEQIGAKNYELLKQVKYTWDPNNVFNANKIVDTPPMNDSLRYESGQDTPQFPTAFRFHGQNILQHAEQCNGSGDCRKTHLSGGTMCPSYMVTRDERDTTRARANMLREMLTRPNGQVENDPNGSGLDRFDSKEVKEVLDLCLVCKACKSECPSNVDMAKLKMEFTYQYQKKNGIPLRSRMIGNFSGMSKLASNVPWAYNFIFKNTFTRKIANTVVGFHPDRTMPLLHSTTFKKWFEKNKGEFSNGTKGKVYFFADEFTNYNDVEIGKKAVQLLNRLGYIVEIPNHVDSGRSFLSKGMLDEAKVLANKNVEELSKVVSTDVPLLGLEPSCILTFRDEYPELVDEALVSKAQALATNALMIDEFLAKELDQKRISKEQFTQEEKLIKLHGHCQQKAVGSLVATKKSLSIPANYKVQLIPSGCCGMAGSFGYEKEHYDLSMKVGELVLFPAVREASADTIIAASGTSCRHQIHDGTGKKSLHPVEILWEALV